MKLFGSVLFILSQFKSGLPRHCFDVRAEFDPYPQGNGIHSARIKMYLNIGYEFHNSEINIRWEPWVINTVVQKKSTARQRDLFFLVHDIFVSYEGELHDSVMSCDLFNNDI